MSTAKKIAVFVSALAVAGVTSGCVESNNSSEQQVLPTDCQAVYQQGANSQKLQQEWKTGQESIQALADTVSGSEVTLTDPFAATDTTDVATPAEPGSFVAAKLSIFDGATGERVYDTEAVNGAGRSDFLQVLSEPGLLPLSDALRCTVPGQEGTAVFGIAEALTFNQQFGVTAGANTVAHFQVAAVSEGNKAQGKELSLPNGFPAVTRTVEGVPGVVLPPTAAPTQLRSAVSIAGTGKPVTADDELLLQYTTINWENGAVVATTWEEGQQPQLLSVAEAENISWRSELNDVPVGSQVVILTPKNADRAAAVTVIDILLAG